MPAAFLVRTRKRSLGALSLLALLGVGLGSIPGCLDDTGTAPATCTAGQVDDKSPTDCKQLICTDGVMTDQADDTEVPEDMNPCTIDACVGGVAKNDARQDGEACMLGDKAGTCGAGKCEVSCMLTSDCDDTNPCTSDSCGVDKKCAFVANDAAIPDDSNPCTKDVCQGGVAQNTAEPVGTSCGQDAKCDGFGSCQGCKTDTQCPADTACADNFCEVASGTCKSTPLADGPIADVQKGDCKVTACLAGQIVANPDDSDVPMGGNDCVDEGCSNGMPTSMPKASQAPCAAGVCDGAGMCVQCVATNNCQLDFTCAMNQCFDCNDGTKNGNETDLDCGGECISRCSTGKMCLVTADCDGECDNGVCVDCFDGTKNGTEGDIDCGGVCAQKCSTGQSCGIGTDCSNGVCTGNKCVGPTCMDAVKNGTESDVDCGGSCATKCGSGKSCTKNSDCVSNMCNDNNGVKTCG